MSYYISAWIVAGNIITVESDTLPITENHLPDLSCDFRVVAEVSGSYEDAVDIFPILTWDGEKLGGVPVVNQLIASEAI